MSNKQKHYISCERCKTHLNTKGGVNIVIRKFDEQQTIQGEINMLYCTQCAEKVISGIA